MSVYNVTRCLMIRLLLTTHLAKHSTLILGELQPQKDQQLRIFLPGWVWTKPFGLIQNHSQDNSLKSSLQSLFKHREDLQKKSFELSKQADFQDRPRKKIKRQNIQTTKEIESYQKQKPNLKHKQFKREYSNIFCQQETQREMS